MPDDLWDDLPQQRKPVLPLTLDDFHDDECGVPRVPHWRLAEVLGFSFGPNVRHLIERHRPALEKLATFVHGEQKATGGRPGREYLLTFEQAIYVIAKSDAPNAEPVLLHVVTIYGLWAQGKLKPTDAATATEIAVETTRAYQQSPEIMELLQGLLERITDLPGKVVGIDTRLASVQRTALEILDRQGDLVKRRPAPVRHQDIYDRVVQDFYLGRCPCCMKTESFIIRNGRRTSSYTLDHVTDNPYKNALHEMWPVCAKCNHDFKRNQRYRAETMERFRVFQSHVAEINGQRLI
jgi:hypothetical protein